MVGPGDYLRQWQPIFPVELTAKWSKPACSKHERYSHRALQSLCLEVSTKRPAVVFQYRVGGLKKETPAVKTQPASNYDFRLTWRSVHGGAGVAYKGAPPPPPFPNPPPAAPAPVPPVVPAPPAVWPLTKLYVKISPIDVNIGVGETRT